MERTTIEVVAAVVERGGQVLATQRGNGEWQGWWEFPGGKIEEGESHEKALRREMMEELGVEVEVGELIKSVEYDYPKFRLHMHLYHCNVCAGEPTLYEHSAARWLDPEELETLRWLPADREVLPSVIFFFERK